MGKYQNWRCFVRLVSGSGCECGGGVSGGQQCVLRARPCAVGRGRAAHEAHRPRRIPRLQQRHRGAIRRPRQRTLPCQRGMMVTHITCQNVKKCREIVDVDRVENTGDARAGLACPSHKAHNPPLTQLPLPASVLARGAIPSVSPKAGLGQGGSHGLPRKVLRANV